MALQHTKQIDQLFTAILSLKNEDECYQYFEDLCTVREIQTIAQRMEVARMLSKGQSYQQTMTVTGASSATISRVKRSLEYGAEGYTLILKRMEESEDTP